jgi:hypothetical protein
VKKNVQMAGVNLDGVSVSLILAFNLKVRPWVNAKIVNFRLKLS